MYYFSASAMVFNYGASIWADGVEVSDETYSALMTYLNKGYTLAADENGYPYGIPPAVPPPEPTIQEVFAKRLDLLNNDYERAVEYLKSTYPRSETITWTLQLAEARKIFRWLNENPTLTIDDLPADVAPFLSSLSARRDLEGVPGGLLHLAERVITNDGIFTPALADVTGIRHGIERNMYLAVDADNIAQLEAITWVFPFPPVIIE
ncbi:hypothetical protein D3C78_728450 [compost metagenome]